MKPITAASYLFGLIPGILAISGNLAGGRWTLCGTAFIVALCVADWFFKDNDKTEADDSSATPNFVLMLHLVFNTLAIGTLYWAVASGRLAGGRISDAALSTGLNSGISGIVVAHELIHRRRRAWRLAGIWNLLLVNYAHFYIEHVQGHHKLVATAQDSSTALQNESIYWYLIRAVPQQWLCALRIEAKRVGKAGRGWYSPANFVILTTLLQLLIGVLIYVLCGPALLSAHLRQGAIAVLFLQVVTYLQHYGLSRTPGTKIEPAHSWQSDRISSRFMLLELPRHADHHCHSTRPYHKLTSQADSPVLPAGLLGTAPLVLVPPIWFWIANRQLPQSTSAPVMEPVVLDLPAC
jgi:alkane 1-monooxygenase